MMKDIFLVDLDDTLLDFQKAESANLKYALSAFSLPFDEQILSRFHRINDALWKAFERGEIDRERLKVKRFEELFSEFRLLADPGAVALSYWRHFPSVCFPFEGSEDFLKTLSKRGKVFVVTNGGTAIQTGHIAISGFGPYLSDVFLSEKIGFQKPSLAFADYVEAHISGYSRDRAVWIGDSLTSDGKCAENRGIDFILFAPQGAPEGYVGLSAKTYEEILKLL